MNAQPLLNYRAASPHVTAARDDMMMNELPLTWHVDLRLRGHVTVKKESHSSRCIVGGLSQNSCKTTEQKSSVSSLLRKKLSVMAVTELTPQQTVPNRCNSCPGIGLYLKSAVVDAR